MEDEYRKRIKSKIGVLRAELNIEREGTIQRDRIRYAIKILEDIINKR